MNVRDETVEAGDGKGGGTKVEVGPLTDTGAGLTGWEEILSSSDSNSPVCSRVGAKLAIVAFVSMLKGGLTDGEQGEEMIDGMGAHEEVLWMEVETC